MHAGDHGHRPHHKEPAERRRTVAELKSGKHNCEVVRHQFACAHCWFHNTQTKAGAEPTWVEVEDPKRMDFNGLRSHLAARYGPFPYSLSNSRTSMGGGLTHKVRRMIRHQVHDVRNEDYYWLPRDESMEPAKKEGQEPRVEIAKAKKPGYVPISRFSSLCSVTKPGVHDPDPYHDYCIYIAPHQPPQLQNQNQNRRKT